MDRIIEFQKWVSDCIRDGKDKLDLSSVDVCYVLSVALVKELLLKIKL